MRRRNIVAGLALIVCGLAYGYLAWDLPVRSLPNTPGPSFFPLVVAVILLILSIALVVRALVFERDAGAGATRTAGARTNGRQALWAIGAFIAYAVLLPFLGFIVATVPFFALLMVLFGERRLLVAAVSAVIATAVLYWLFRHGFGVFLPRGILRGIVA